MGMLEISTERLTSHKIIPPPAKSEIVRFTSCVLLYQFCSLTSPTIEIVGFLASD